MQPSSLPQYEICQAPECRQPYDKNHFCSKHHHQNIEAVEIAVHDFEECVRQGYDNAELDEAANELANQLPYPYSEAFWAEIAVYLPTPE